MLLRSKTSRRRLFDYISERIREEVTAKVFARERA